MKKVFNLLLCLFILVACGDKNINYEELDGHDYIELLEDYTPREKNKNNKVDDEDFETYLNDMFIETMESDYLYTHFTVVDLDQYDIEKPELSLGELEYSEEPNNELILADYERLKSFDYDKLAYEQQYDYDCIEYSLLESLAYSYYEHYDLLFDGGTDLLSSIVTNFEEFVFYKQEDIEDYLVLLKDIDRYLDDALIYTAKQGENGLYLSDYSIDYSVDYVDGFVSKENDNSLITTFENKIAELDYLDEETKNSYIQQNEEIVLNEVLPSYKKVAEELENYYGKTELFSNALCNIDEDYAKITYMLTYSSNLDPKEVYKKAKKANEELLTNFTLACYNQQAINEYYAIMEGELAPFNEDYESILTYLNENYQKLYPSVADIDYDLSLLDASSASDSIIAYYVTPPIDEPDNNVIRVNPNADTSGVTAYTTLAHEGIPGHMYQAVYCNNLGLSLGHKVQSFIGYVEGYACYSQLEALKLTSIDSDTIALLTIDNIEPYIMESIVDIGVNYLEWDLEDVEDYMNEVGYDGSYAEMIVEDVIDRPATLVSYGIGYLNFKELYDYASEELGSKFVNKEFNQVILENGEQPFPIVWQAVEDFVENYE